MAKDIETARPTYDDDKLYSYTWPGSTAKVVTGKVLTEIVKGADPAQLDIHVATVGSDGDAIERAALDRASKIEGETLNRLNKKAEALGYKGSDEEDGDPGGFRQ